MSPTFSIFFAWRLISFASSPSDSGLISNSTCTHGEGHTGFNGRELELPQSSISISWSRINPYHFFHVRLAVDFLSLYQAPMCLDAIDKDLKKNSRRTSSICWV